MLNIKTWLQLAAAVVMAVWAALTDEGSADAITPAEWIIIATMAVGAVGVYIVPNLDRGIGTFAKGVVSFLTAALPSISLSLADGLTNTEKVQALVVGLAAVGLVTAVGNRGYRFATKRPATYDAGAVT